MFNCSADDLRFVPQRIPSSYLTFGTPGRPYWVPTGSASQGASELERARCGERMLHYPPGFLGGVFSPGHATSFKAGDGQVSQWVRFPLPALRNTPYLPCSKGFKAVHSVLADIKN
jgi:hypothetical protein